MKKFIVMCMVLMLIIVPGCSKEEKKATEKDGIAALLPESTQLMVKVRSLEDLFKTFPLTETSVFYQPLDNLEEIREDFGFNPFSLEELKTHGIDIGKEFGVAFADFMVDSENDVPNINISVFIPVTDGEKLLETLKTAAQKKSSTVTFTQEGDITVIEDTDDKVKGYIAEKNSYVFIAVNPKTDAKPFIESILAGKTSLAKSDRYADVTSHIMADEEIFVYVNIKSAIEKNRETLEMLAKSSPDKREMTEDLRYLADYEDGGMAFELDKGDLIITTYAGMVSDSQYSKIWNDVTFDKNTVLGIETPPVFLFSWGMNFAAYYEMFMKTFFDEDVEDVNNELKNFKEMYGIDVENDIIENLAGNINFGMYDGSSISMMNFNALLTLNVKDEDAAKHVIETAIESLPSQERSTIRKETVGEVEAYVMSAGFVQVYFGLHKKNLIVAVGKPMFEKALSGQVSSGFTNNLQDEHLVATLTGDTSMFYMDFEELMKVYRNFEGFLQGAANEHGFTRQRQDAVKNFEYVAASNTYKDDSILGELIVKTQFTGPFFVELGKLINNNVE